MAEIKVTNLVKLCTLLTLSKGPVHGYELMKGLEQMLERKISASNVYPFLAILEKKKFVVVARTGERDKKEYRLTTEGKKFLEHLLLRMDSLIEASIKSKLTTCSHCGARLYHSGHKEKMNGKELFFCCTYCAASYKKSN
ncbi:MAG: PadR family transcriptional regulator [Nanoarchaeota archaeon]